MYWCVLTADNHCFLFGEDDTSRISDGDGRIYSWLLRQSYDCYGNVIEYSYKAEDSVGVPNLLSERNRTPETRSRNRYLKAVKYGNRVPTNHPGTLPPTPGCSKWFLTTVNTISTAPRLQQMGIGLAGKIHSLLIVPALRFVPTDSAAEFSCFIISAIILESRTVWYSPQILNTREAESQPCSKRSVVSAICWKMANIRASECLPSVLTIANLLHWVNWRSETQRPRLPLTEVHTSGLISIPRVYRGCCQSKQGAGSIAAI